MIEKRMWQEVMDQLTISPSCKWIPAPSVCVCVRTRVYHSSHDVSPCECATHLCVLFVCTCLGCIYVHTHVLVCRCRNHEYQPA
jgi:hypothetical protein